MAALSETRKELICRILEKIAKCEGGEVVVHVTEDGDYYIALSPEIPPEYWCDECKKRTVCKLKLMARWQGARTI